MSKDHKGEYIVKLPERIEQVEILKMSEKEQ